MENLNQRQYEAVLAYMEAHPSTDFQHASEIMAKLQYDITKIQETEEQVELAGEHPLYELPAEQLDGHENLDEEELDKMRKYLLKRIQVNNKSRKMIKRSRECISKMCLKVTEKILPELIKRKIIRSPFYKLYQDSSVIELTNKTIPNAILKAKEERKHLLVVISNQQKNSIIAEFLRNKKLIHEITLFFEVVGVTEEEIEGYPELRNERACSIVAVRQNQMEETVVVERFVDREIQKIDINRVKELVVNINELEKRQIQKIRRATNRIFQNVTIHQPQTIHNANIPRVQPEPFYEEYEEQDRKIAIIKNKKESKIIKEQNKQYEKMRAEREKLLQLEQLKKKQAEDLKEERNARKMSIPDEPTDQNQENVIKFQFRCPNGETVKRNFIKTQKCEILFNWVDLNEEIQLEEEDCNQQGMRRFDLLYSYPPQSLKSKLDTPLEEIFEESFIKIVIKEQ